MCSAFKSVSAPLTLLVTCFVIGSGEVSAEVLATATFDTDSYVFIGTTNGTADGISTFTDYSNGVLDANNAHFNFGVIKFDDLSGIQTFADGGGRKYLTLDTIQVGNAAIAFSVAGDDIQGGYPSPLLGGADGGPNGRLQWYFDNIKGDDGTVGGYVGGAKHLGVLNVSSIGAYSLDVTEAVDDWLDGNVDNFGFGLWAAASDGVDGSPVDFASIENADFSGPRLVSVAVPEPGSAAPLLAAAIGLLGSRRRRRRSRAN